MEVTAFNAIIIFFILQIRLTIKILTVLFKHFNRLHFHIYINSYIINYKKQYKNITGSFGSQIQSINLIKLFLL
jgi:hypothetical protein